LGSAKATAGYYILYAARYFQGMISVLFEHKRKDFLEMEVRLVCNGDRRVLVIFPA
jgi:hypothetical protein